MGQGEEDLVTLQVLGHTVGQVSPKRKARAAVKGIEWQAKFLAVFPPFVLVLIGLTTPEAGKLYARNPLYVMPVLVSSALSYWLSMGMVRNGLSIEASMGPQNEEVFR